MSFVRQIQTVYVSVLIQVSITYLSKLIGTHVDSQDVITVTVHDPRFAVLIRIRQASSIIIGLIDAG